MDDAPAGDVVVGSEPVVYQDGPLMLFLDTSALLAMLGGNSATPTAFKLSLLQVRLDLATLHALTLRMQRRDTNNA
jgi:hypothetical protein